MNVSGVAYIKVRAKNVNGDLNKHGEFHMIPCLISSTVRNEMYLSWRDLQLLGSISPYIPEVWTERHTWTQKRATMTERVRAAKATIAPEIDDIFEEYRGVFVNDLAGGKHINDKMDIKLNEKIQII